MEELTSKKLSLIDKDLKDYTTKIKRCGDNIKKNYIKIAHLLSEVDSKECYLEDGFESVIDYAGQVLGIQKTTAYNMLKIGKEYVAENGERTILTEKGEDYSVSQIQALLPLGVEKVKEINEDGTITPEMSVRQIKNLVKGLTESPDPEEEEDENTVDGESGEETEEVIKSFGSIEFLEDGDIIARGSLPDGFIQTIEEYFKNSLEDKEFEEFSDID